MIFGFLKKKTHNASNNRDQYRQALPNPRTFDVTLKTQVGPPIKAEAADLTMTGCGIRVLLEDDPALAPGDVIEVTLRNAKDDWTVSTPVRVCHVAQSGFRHLLYGFEFINIGNLYSQMDNAFAKFFNRRAERRVQPNLDEQTPVSLKAGEYAISGVMHDISDTGLGVIVLHQQGAPLVKDTRIALRFKLPNVRKEMVGHGWVRRIDTISGKIVAGIEFDFEEAGGIVKGQALIAEFIKRRQQEMRAQQHAWAK